MFGIGQVEEAAMSRAREEPNFPPLSVEIVETVMEAGGLGKEQRTAVENGLRRIRDEYLESKRKLEFHVSDRNLEVALTAVKNRAASLTRTLDHLWITSKMTDALLLTHPDPRVSDREVSDKICDGFDDDIKAVSRIHELAVKALARHDDQIKQWPNRSANPNPPAKKPEDLDLTLNILRLWGELGRSERGRDASDLANFAGRILEYMLERAEISPHTVDDQLRKARAARAPNDSPGDARGN